MKIITTLALVALSLSAEVKEDTIELVKPLISYTSTQDAKDDVKAVYAEIKAAYGVVPEPIKGLSLNPKMLRNQWEAYKIMGENKNFSPMMTTMMRMLVAENHHCKFCVGFNQGMLINLFKLPANEVATLQKDPSTARLDAKQKAMLLFMIKSTTNPSDVSRKDIEALKKLGWSEKDIMEGVKQASEMVATSLFIDTFKIE